MQALKAQGVIERNVEGMKGVKEKVWQKVFYQCYDRAVGPDMDRLREYAAFSDNVYGELLPGFLNEMCVPSHSLPLYSNGTDGVTTSQLRENPPRTGQGLRRSWFRRRQLRRPSRPRVRPSLSSPASAAHPFLLSPRTAPAPSRTASKIWLTPLISPVCKSSKLRNASGSGD